MRLSSVVALVGCLVACGNKSKLDGDRAADVDRLWDLAPDGTQMGIVASSRAVGLAFDGLAAVRAVMSLPDFAATKPQIDELARAMFGSEAATPADAGLGAKPFALFTTADAVIGVMPVIDRDKYMAARHGTRGSGSADDVLEANMCREVRGYYVCTTKVEMFDRLGKGSLRGKLAIAGARGDAELYTSSANVGDTKGELAVAVQLERGSAALTGHWLGKPSGVLEKLVGMTSPRPSTDGVAGFVSFDAAPLLASVPSLPIAGGVTTDQLAASMAGPITGSIPAGAIDIQLHIPLKDPAPAQTIVDHCTDIGAMLALAEKQTPGACRIRLEGTNALELDIWVEGKELRVGAKKGPAPAGKPGALTPIGRELASHDWTASLWGRGTMLNLTGIPNNAAAAVPDEVAFGIHAMALMNELGAAVRVENDGVRFRAAVRTVWTNPPDVVAKYVAVSGADIAAGKATETAKQIAATAPDSPFAADFDAGQGGLMIPAAAIGLVSAIIVPAVTRYLSGGGPEAEDTAAPTDTGPPLESGDLANLLVHAYVEEAFPKWRAEHKGEKCPKSLDDLAAYFGADPGIPVKTDPWGHDLVMTCDDKGVAVLSLGPDGQKGTDDDIHVP